MSRHRWYIPYVMKQILKYLFDMCISSSGETVTIDYETMWSTLSPTLQKHGVTERMFRYVWRLFLKQYENYIVYRHRHRGKTVFSRDICDNVVPVIIVTKIADMVIEREREMMFDEKLRQAIRYFQQLLSSGGEDGACGDKCMTSQSSI